MTSEPTHHKSALRDTEVKASPLASMLKNSSLRLLVFLPVFKDSYWQVWLLKSRTSQSKLQNPLQPSWQTGVCINPHFAAQLSSLVER